MSIKTQIDELEKIQNEIKRNNSLNKTLRQRANEIESNISAYLHEKNEPGLKYNGKAIIVERREKRSQKSKKDKRDDVVTYLENLGLENPSTVYEKILDVQKRSPKAETKIKVKKLRNAY